MPHFLPLAVVFDVKNAHAIPKLEPGNSMRYQRLRPLVLRVNQGILGVHLVLGLGAPKLSQKVLFFHASFREFHANLADLIIALGLIERAPALSNLETYIIL